MQTKNYLSKHFLWGMLALAFTLITIFSFAQNGEKEKVKVKIVKTVDGKTTVIEKTMDEANVSDFTKQFEDIKGKNVQISISVEGASGKKGTNSFCKSSCAGAGTNCSTSSMHFNFDMDSAMIGSFSKMFKMNEDGKDFVLNDSMMKNLTKNFDFNFNFDDVGEMLDFNFDINTDKDGKTVIIKNKNGKTIVINGEDEAIAESESENGKTKTKTFVIKDENGKSKKKIIFSTSVMVIDLDEESSKKKQKEETNFSFYPNPSDGDFSLELNLDGKEPALVRIVDMTGKEIYNETVTGTGKTTKSISLGDNKKGTFIVTIKQGKKMSSKKIIIE